MVDQIGTIDTTGLSGGLVDVLSVAAPTEEEIAAAEEEAAAEGEAGEEEGGEEPGVEGQSAEEPPAGEPVEEPAPEPEEETEPPPGEPEPEPEVTSTYDPGEHTVVEVNEYIAAHPEERDAILAAEAAGKARSGILNG